MHLVGFHYKNQLLVYFPITASNTTSEQSLHVFLLTRLTSERVFGDDAMHYYNKYGIQLHKLNAFMTWFSFRTLPADVTACLFRPSHSNCLYRSSVTKCLFTFFNCHIMLALLPTEQLTAYYRHSYCGFLLESDSWLRREYNRKGLPTCGTGFQ